MRLISTNKRLCPSFASRRTRHSKRRCNRPRRHFLLHWFVSVVALINFLSTTECSAGLVLVGDPRLGNEFLIEWLATTGEVSTSAYSQGTLPPWFDEDSKEIPNEKTPKRNASLSSTSSLFGASSRAVASNFSSLRAGAWASVTNTGEDAVAADASSYASNSQSVLLDFRNSPLRNSHPSRADAANQIYAYITFHGFVEQHSGVRDEQGFIIGNTADSAAFVDIDGEYLSELVYFDLSTVALDIHRELFTEEQWFDIRPSERHASGFVTLSFRALLDRIPLTEYIDPLTGKTRVDVARDGESETRNFALYEWNQALAVAAGVWAPNPVNDLRAVFDLTRTLEFSYATLTDGSSLESHGISLYHINEIALASQQSAAVPEPSSLVLFGIGIVVASMGAVGRRRPRRPLLV